MTFNTNVVELYGHINGTMRPKPIRTETATRLENTKQAMVEFRERLENSELTTKDIHEYLEKVERFVPTDTR
jgi:hypothetical protein